MIERGGWNLHIAKQNQTRRVYPLQIHGGRRPECRGARHCDHL
uniref:Uncharacterized protein n=1 Tax=Siphoviridae sp. ct6ro14 TaxID=2826300 RepID=A0A8S5MKQ2_9CAUD|nr:MAG TPA: hypothetical protein [Siphoviridae sp. ct6ro14]